ncbi:MAG: endolytic transglycosylase MltG [Prevotellaceae bacterium]|jgi:UPF0755 protein|nr:endolytic transglycosylase MltG [Prevotellaceae bacterium]
MIKRKQKSKIAVRIVIIYVLVFSAITAYRFLSSDRIELKSSKVNVYIPSDSSLEQVADSLMKKRVFAKKNRFMQHAKLQGYSKVKGGRYIVTRGMSYRKLINMLASGSQTPVNLTISGNIRTREQLAAVVSSQIEADSVAILNLLNNKQMLAELGFAPENSILLFMPNTYNVYWNRNPTRLFKDMKKQYDDFWNTKRTSRLDSLKMSRNEVMIIASIAIEESSNVDELPRIAGVYINRLRRKMPLQADPTVKYAVGDFALRRVLTKHTEHNSPYNTYKHTGLPPGPICIPSPVAVDATLNYEHHDYLFFCAKDDFSGRHVFAKTLQQHSQNAETYRRALNKRRIYR